MAIQRKHSQGFTLIEMMVVIAIIGILAAMAAPSFGKMIAEKQAEQATKDIIFAFTQARSQSALSGKNATIVLTQPNDPIDSSKKINVLTVKFYDSTGAVKATTTEYSLSSKVKLKTNMTVGSDYGYQPNGQLVNASTQTNLYFRVCPNSSLSGLEGFNAWINPFGISRFAKGTLASIDGDTNSSTYSNAACGTF